MTIVDPIRPSASTPEGTTIIGGEYGEGPGPEVMAADTLRGDKVISVDNEELGKISEIMLDVRGGRIAYAVLSSGGFLGIGDTLRAIPWSALTLDAHEKCFRLAVTAESVKNAPAFDNNAWPSMVDPEWGRQVHAHYQRRPYWLASEPTLPNHPPEAL